MLYPARKSAGCIRRFDGHPAASICCRIGRCSSCCRPFVSAICSQLTGIENFAIGTESWRYAAFKSDRLLQRQLGRCWLIRVSRGDLHSLDCFVEPEATIAELKHVVALESKHLIRRLGGPYRSVSWRQVWRRFALALGSKKLLDDRATLSDCGLSNRCQLTFVPRLREKPSGGRRRRQQWQQ
ncbi:hypothetical protein BOX15_Mlig017750g5 [Macrostomum lignano]|uniref:SNRNP25 ubiquitin-like domain-containing protein n=1 Tax=Macrostomum lignano TaxID=282301 RepID=A0A267G7U7_9PLAT|nr:hypothetical protein BOX15_Mlig017750g5 [Macrostomum lignano]